MSDHHEPVGEFFFAQVNRDQEYLENFSTTQTIGSRQIKLFDVGVGEPVVFLPMAAELNFLYVSQIKEFEVDRRVISYEPNLSWGPKIRISDRAKEFISIIDALKLESVHIVAWSDVGAVAYYLAKHWPERCRSIVFIALADKYQFPQPLHFLLQIFSSLPIEDFIPTWVVAYILGKFMGGPRIKPNWIAQYATRFRQLPRVFKYSFLPNMLEHHPVAHEVSTPCIVICGDNDPVVSVRQAQQMANLLSSAGKAVIIPGGEHLLNYANATIVNQIIRDFYSS